MLPAVLLWQYLLLVVAKIECVYWGTGFELENRQFKDGLLTTWLEYSQRTPGQVFVVNILIILLNTDKKY